MTTPDLKSTTTEERAKWLAVPSFCACTIEIDEDGNAAHHEDCRLSRLIADVEGLEKELAAERQIALDDNEALQQAEAQRDEAVRLLRIPDAERRMPWEEVRAFLDSIKEASDA